MNNLLTFQNILRLLLLRLAQGSRKCCFQDPGPPSSHTVKLFQQTQYGFKLYIIISDMYLDELLLHVVIHWIPGRNADWDLLALK